MKTTVIYHRADFDGLFCREIARRKFDDKATYVGWDYDDPVPDIPADTYLYMLDISVAGLMDHPGLVWIDHHRTAIDKFPGDIPGLRIDGVAACRLTWQWFFGNPQALREEYVDRSVGEPLAVQLAGEYDIWDKRDPRAELFQHGLRSRDLTYWWPTLLTAGETGNRLVRELLHAGAALQYARQGENESIIMALGFTVNFEGLTFLALNSARGNSLVFLAGLKPEHDGCLLFNWAGRDWRVSLYGAPGKPEIDLTPIAKKFGGGGHRQACGFRIPSLPFVQPLVPAPAGS